MKAYLKKLLNGCFAPANGETQEWADKYKPGEVAHGDFTKMRNYGYHQKFFALLDFAYEYWIPGEIDTKWGKPEKNRETYRNNVTIQAGYGYPVFNIDGTFKMKAKSISFAKMDQEEFEKLYNSVLTVLMKKILVGMDEDEIEKLTDQFLSFA